jgi:hypothetical protein
MIKATGCSLKRQPLVKHLDVTAQVALKCSKNNLPLAGFQAIHHAWDAAFQVRAAEQNQLLCTEKAKRVTIAITMLSSTQPL